MVLIGSTSQHSALVHASAVCLNGSAAVLIIGPSGSGKSALALELMAYGAQLISDDQTHLERSNDQVFASPAPNIAGLIEARGVGLLKAQQVDQIQVHLVVDMEQESRERLPKRLEANLFGLPVAMVHYVKASYFPAAVLQLLKEGRYA